MMRADLAHGGVISATHHSGHAQIAEIAELQSRTEKARAMSIVGEQTAGGGKIWIERRFHSMGTSHHPAGAGDSLTGTVNDLQGQVTALQGQQGPTGGPALPELPEDGGSSS
ncbi:hypothetical protein Tco_0299972 [Tanacetum coccineum]